MPKCISPRGNINGNARRYWLLYKWETAEKGWLQNLFFDFFDEDL